MRGALLFLSFIACVPLANWMVGHVGTCYPGGPCVILVAPGIYAPSAVLVIGLAFVLRDLVQRRLGIFWGILAVPCGAVASLLVAPPELSLASFAGFAVAESINCAIFTSTRGRGFIVAMLAGSIVGAALDSAVFLQIGFHSLVFFPGQFIGKLEAISIAALALAATRQARTA